jgi:hypothetical protein
MSYQYGQQIYNKLYADIQNHYGVSALMGNLVAESGLIPHRCEGDFSTGYQNSLNYTAQVDRGEISESEFVNYGYNGSTSQKGYGLAQWTYYTRKQGLYDMKQSMGVSIGSVELACAYLLQELKTSFPGVYEALINATNIRTPSNIVLHDFENPAAEHQEVEDEIYRASLGTEIYNLYSGSVAPDEPDNPDVPSVRRKRKKYNFLLFNRKRFNYYG